MSNLTPTDEPTPPDLPWSDRPVWPGVSCGPGWYPILRDLDTDLRQLVPNYEVVQVKEKFGTLSFYIAALENVTDDQFTAVRERIRAAEEQSARTCERCGAPGSLREGPWLRTLCDECSTRPTQN